MLHIFTLTWNGADKIEKLYKSLKPALKDIPHKWTIKDNASKDNSVELIKSWQDPNIDLIEYKDNLQNFAQGMNHCFKHANPSDEDPVMLLNNDVIVEDKNSIKNMLSLLGKKDVGLVGAKLVYTDTDKIQHCGVVFNKMGHPYHLRSGVKESSIDNANREFQAVTGAVWLTKAGIYKQISANKETPGLDERFIWGFEDIDGCLYIKYTLGKKVVYCGESKFFHEESASLKKNPQNKLFLNPNMKLLKEKWSSKFSCDDHFYSNQKYNLLK